MKNVFKFIGIITIVAIIGLSVTSCASYNWAPFTNVQGDYFNSSVSISKKAQATNKIWLGIFGTESFPSAAKVAQDNNIKKIASVEYNVRPGIFCIWMDFTTIVSGE
jgi:hypothetical protein